MTTTTVPIAITCPDWCNVTPETHPSDLWDMDGDCIHWPPSTIVADATGYRGSSTDTPLLCAPVEVRLSTVSNPDGGPQPRR